MDPKKKEIIDTYNNSAKELVEYFSQTEARTDDINKVFRLSLNKENPRVLEIGCGGGRDAREILKITNFYDGFDISKETIEIAQSKNKLGNFFVVDFENYTFTNDKYDIVFSFASLLHSDRINIEKVIKKISSSIVSNGFLFISLKEKDKYQIEIKEDRFGRRTFYFYTPELIESFAEKYFETVFIETQKIGKTNWFSILLRKR